MSLRKVLKFGGSVLKNVDDIKNIKSILTNKENEKYQIIVIFSAFYNITNHLLEIGKLCEKNKKYNNKLEELKKFHFDIATKLALDKKSIDTIKKLFKKIENILLVVEDNSKITEENNDYLLAFGERLSNFIIYSYLKKTEKVEQISPCKIIKTDSNFGYAKVDFEESEKLIKKCFDKLEKNNVKIVVCAGFFASDKNDRITTLGRNGSDYSASILASALNVEKLEIWKDIDGLYTTDPKIVENVKFIKQISYQEMAELSSLGNKVIHINAISPCITKNIPILLKNCYNHKNKGTLIGCKGHKNYLINGIIKMDNVLILSLELNEYANLTEIGIKMQKILQNYEDIVITISQNIKQKKFSLIISNARSDKLIASIKKEFRKLVDSNDLIIDIGELKSMITIIGANFSSAVGISGKIFNVLETNKININAIHDDFSKTRISFLCQIKDANKIVNLLHKELVN